VAKASDLYRLTKDELLTLDGIAEKSSQNILDAIKGSRDRDFERVVFALGIRHVGWTTASSLARAMGSMERLQDASVEELSRIEGIGLIVAESVRDFFRNQKNRQLVEELKKAGLRMEAAKRAKSLLDGKSFIFTGELKSMPRSEAEALVVSLGGNVTSSVSKTTDYVVVGENPGSKLQKARSMNKEIIDEDAFLKMVKKR
jgi:DNA ligase (NAD+)